MRSTFPRTHDSGPPESSWAEATAAANCLAYLRTGDDRTSRVLPVLASVRLPVPAPTRAALESVCRGTPFLTWTALVAGTALYVSKYARCDSFAFIAPARKDSPGLVPAAVFPVLLRVEHNVTFREFLQSCRTQLATRYENPPARATQLTSTGSTAPNSECPCQIAVAHASLHSSLPENAADIRITFEHHEGSPYATATFNASLFSEQAIKDLLSGQFELLQQGLNQPNRYLSELSAMSPDDAEVMYGTQEPPIDAEPAKDFLDVFEGIVSAQPDAIAVQENDITVSYGELDYHAGKFSQLLLSWGIRAEDIVGVAMNRNATAIAAILGIWKAGAAYLPVDLDLPRKRLSRILEDSCARVVLTDRDLSTLAFENQIPLVHARQVDMSGEVSSQEGRADRHPERLAYVIYTSGSTGRPKGVLLSHRGLSSLTRAQRKIFTADECRNVLQFSAHSFDASIFDITMALGHGGTLHMSGDLQIPTGDELLGVLRDQQVTLATIPPSVLATLPPGELPDLKTLVVAGEACPQPLAEQWSKRVRFVNAYGPTETTVWATFEQGTPDVSITIGAAIPGCRTYVLDNDLQPLPPGFPGELCLSGDNLARGFVGLPATAAQRFVPNALAKEPGQRIYRTGDLVVLRQDGRLEFLGRDDDQYKIRGYRIELGEIEAALGRHPQVEQAAVTVRDGPGDSKTIVAYAVAKMDATLEPSALREFVSEHVPEYMVPSQFVMLDRMPLTRSGKSDKHSLLRLESAAQPESPGRSEKPANPIEQGLIQIWAELFERKNIGPEENFFELGGHSLLAIQVVSRIKQQFGVPLHPRRVFDAPTIRLLARRVEEVAQSQVPPVETERCGRACDVVAG